jgi:hypothetical protein
MTKKPAQPSVSEEITRLKTRLNSLLSDEPVMWDEVNAVERELKFLGAQVHDYQDNKPYAAEDAALAMMESAAERKFNG